MQTISQQEGKIMTPSPDSLRARITQYLCNGGLFNPELADHNVVRDLLRDCRDALEAAGVGLPAGWRAVLKNVTDELKLFVEGEGCDHDVGICMCATFRAIENAEALLAAPAPPVAVNDEVEKSQ